MSAGLGCREPLHPLQLRPCARTGVVVNGGAQSAALAAHSQAMDGWMDGWMDGGPAPRDRSDGDGAGVPGQPEEAAPLGG
eukprot:scaffold1033_cov408-Prasinococcus_capsulatus_cf.AAC.1